MLKKALPTKGDVVGSETGTFSRKGINITTFILKSSWIYLNRSYPYCRVRSSDKNLNVVWCKEEKGSIPY